MSKTFKKFYIWKRLNNGVRSREKTMRGLKKKNTSIIDGYQIFHNYIRGHMALDGLTAEVAGIKVEGKNKWITLYIMQRGINQYSLLNYLKYYHTTFSIQKNPFHYLF